MLGTVPGPSSLPSRWKPDNSVFCAQVSNQVGAAPRRLYTSAHPGGEQYPGSWHYYSARRGAIPWLLSPSAHSEVVQESTLLALVSIAVWHRGPRAILQSAPWFQCTTVHPSGVPHPGSGALLPTTARIGTLAPVHKIPAAAAASFTRPARAIPAPLLKTQHKPTELTINPLRPQHLTREAPGPLLRWFLVSKGAAPDRHLLSIQVPPPSLEERSTWRLDQQEGGQAGRLDQQEGGRKGGWTCVRVDGREAGSAGGWTGRRLDQREGGQAGRLDQQEGGRKGGWTCVRVDGREAGPAGGWTGRRLDQREGGQAGRLDQQEGGQEEGWTSRRVDRQEGGREEGWTSRRVDRKEAVPAGGWTGGRLDQQEGRQAGGWTGGRLDQPEGGQAGGWTGRRVDGRERLNQQEGGQEGRWTTRRVDGSKGGPAGGWTGRRMDMQGGGLTGGRL
ncbi:hypothetical protein NDU88_006853 [Pleurodeles waltl]|uniref:Uncharacterized protein n=1 Tax=Pleurodeles waltl TaxID=8319 RepID=A0AAV7LQU8_PLEWA|nr:hypothetical protein NDU88_006853 [Pleurodeles waltl]